MSKPFVPKGPTKQDVERHFSSQPLSIPVGVSSKDIVRESDSSEQLKALQGAEFIESQRSLKNDKGEWRATRRQDIADAINLHGADDTVRLCENFQSKYTTTADAASTCATLLSGVLNDEMWSPIPILAALFTKNCISMTQPVDVNLAVIKYALESVIVPFVDAKDYTKQDHLDRVKTSINDILVGMTPHLKAHESAAIQILEYQLPLSRAANDKFFAPKPKVGPRKVKR